MDAVTLPMDGARIGAQRANPNAGPWASFFAAVLFLLLFPLLPLGAELLFTRQVAVSSLALVTATYAISLAASSRYLGVWALGLMLGFVFSTIFGWTSAPGTRLGPAYRLDAGPQAPGVALWAPAAMILVVLGIHLWERFIRHVQKKEPFPEFLRQ